MAGPSAAGKGTDRRPTFVSESTFEARWRRTFGAPSAGRMSRHPEETADNHAGGADTRTPPATVQTEEFNE